MKPTIVNVIFASILLGGLYFKKPLLKFALGSALELSDKGWSLLSLRWGLFFLFLAALNEFIWRNSTEDFWVNFKVFGMLTLTMVFSLLQLPLIKKYGKE
jgi:intracellular septation protein